MFFRRLICALILTHSLGAAALDEANALFEARKYPEARVVLEKILATDPNNAAAAHRLGLTLRKRADSSALSEALVWLTKAVELEPNNAAYLADFGGVSMLFADKTRSLTAATKGRDAMIRAVELNPHHLEARDGLMQFYANAPFLVGGSMAKAYTQAEEIRKRDPLRGLNALVGLKLSEKKFANATALYEEALKAEPDHYLFLYQIGRIASLSGANLDRGLAALRRCLELTPPPDSPSHANAHFRIGTLLEKKGDTTAARDAYRAVLKLEPDNTAAADALAKLK